MTVPNVYSIAIAPQQLSTIADISHYAKTRPHSPTLNAEITPIHVLPNWRRHLTIVKPDTVVGWHRSGWRLYWRWRCRSVRGRPKVSAEIRDIIRKMSTENRTWGAPRIHGELLKLGYDVCETTIAKYMARNPGPSAQTWRTFILNHMSEMVAVDFLTVHTATFKTIDVFVILSLERRRVIHFNVTTNPTAEWTSLQLTQAFPFDSAPRFLIRDRGGIYGQKVIDTIKNLGIKQVVISRQSPWQNGFCERVIGSIRRECLDHIIVLNDRHLRRVLKEYFAYYHEARTHLGLKKDAPVSRPVQQWLKPHIRKDRGRIDRRNYSPHSSNSLILICDQAITEQQIHRME